ncbi:MAG: hypothetical protein EON54_07710 [Alcaligenaceae bacterium]|nr:MAG: hypothetical protein EON54_07710 [Alcaligenaceae bacterium]
MDSPDLETVEQTLCSIEALLSARQYSLPAVPYFEPTNLAGLPPAMQESELQNRDEIAYGNRVRASVQSSLASAAASLRICSELLKNSVEKTHAERATELLRLAVEAEEAVNLARDAAAMLSGRASPKADRFADIRKLKPSVFRRFGRP